jgi:hypothetical protein
MPSTTPTVSRRLIKQADEVPKDCTHLGLDLLTDLTVAFLAASVRSFRISSAPPLPPWTTVSGPSRGDEKPSKGGASRQDLPTSLGHPPW